MSTKMKKISELKVPELKAQCKSLHIPNYSKMKKNDLVEARPSPMLWSRVDLTEDENRA